MEGTTKKLPLAVIFGRTNTGKSTLFNRLTEKNSALVSAVPGTTRDVNLAEMEWLGIKFTLADTGGLDDSGPKTKSAGNGIEIMVRRQTISFLKRADLVVFLVDARDGLLPQDKYLALLVKKTVTGARAVVLAANKADSPRLRKDTAEFNKLSLGEPMPVSAATGSGTGDLLDMIVKKLGRKRPADDPEAQAGPDRQTENRDITVAIIGKPNVGKSSLINAIIGENVVIVSPIPHTTREPRNLIFSHDGRKITFIDTAGISKKGQKGAKRVKIKSGLEKLSIARSLGILRKADVVLLVLDISEIITRQDAKLTEEIVNTGAGLIIVANKWDLAEEKDTKAYTQKIYRELPFASWAPVQFVSALTGEKTKKIFDLIVAVHEQRKLAISDSALEKFLGKIVKRHRPAKASGMKHPHIYELKQTGAAPTRFMVRIGAKDTLHFSYIRFVENRLREKFGFTGTPIKIRVVKNKRVHGAHGS